MHPSEPIRRGTSGGSFAVRASTSNETYTPYDGVQPARGNTFVTSWLGLQLPCSYPRSIYSTRISGSLLNDIGFKADLERRIDLEYGFINSYLQHRDPLYCLSAQDLSRALHKRGAYMKFTVSITAEEVPIYRGWQTFMVQDFHIQIHYGSTVIYSAARLSRFDLIDKRFLLKAHVAMDHAIQSRRLQPHFIPQVYEWYMLARKYSTTTRIA